MPDAAPRHGPVPSGSGPEAGSSAAPDGDPIAELVARLREIGLDPDAEGLSDALWLARFTTRRADDVSGGERPPGPGKELVQPPAGQPLGEEAAGPAYAEPPVPSEQLPQAVRDAGRVALYVTPRDVAPRTVDRKSVV